MHFFAMTDFDTTSLILEVSIANDEIFQLAFLGKYIARDKCKT